jgi:Flp pilus assembly protein protease CpaA
MTAQQVILLLSLPPLGLAAWQDVHTRHVSNWITIPLFFLAWPLAWRFNGWDGLLVTAIVFVVTLLAMPVGFGAADGKLAVFLAAAGGLPAVLLALGLVLVLFLLVRLIPVQAQRLPFVHLEEDGIHVAGGVGMFLAGVGMLLVG